MAKSFGYLGPLGFFLRHPFLTLILLAGGAGGYYWWQTADNAAAPEPLLAKVQRGSIENTVSAAGSLAPIESVDVGAQVSGQLETLAVDVGDLVTEQQLLASIDASVQAQQVEASRASLRAQEAQLTGRKAALQLAETNVRRQKNMLEAQATSQQEVDTAINTLMSAQSSLAQLQAQIAQSRAGLASDEAELAYSKIQSPMAGTVVSIAVKEGQTLNASQTAPTVMTVADLTKMTVETEVSEADVGKLKPGMPVYFTTLGNGQRRWYGTLRQVLPTPTVTNNVVLYTALFDVDNRDGTLLNGMTAQVFFVISSARDVLTVPLAALSNISPMIAESGGNKRSDNKSIENKGTENNSAENRPRRDDAITEGDRSPRGEGRVENDEERAQRRKARRAAMEANTGQPRQATVRVMDTMGQIVERPIVIGVSNRVSAEVVSGLEAGEQVVAGIRQSQQADKKSDDRPMRRF